MKHPGIIDIENLLRMLLAWTAAGVLDDDDGMRDDVLDTLAVNTVDEAEGRLQALIDAVDEEMHA